MIEYEEIDENTGASIIVVTNVDDLDVENETLNTQVQRPLKESQNSGNELNLEAENGPIKLGPYRYGCPICSKVMSRSRSVERHILMHTGEKPYQCNICGKRFKSKSYVKTHKKIKHSILGV